VRRSIPLVSCLALLLALAALQPVAAARSPLSHEAIRPLFDEDAAERRRAAEALVARRAVGLVPGLVDAVFFTPKRHRREIFAALVALTGENAGDDFYDWVELVGRRTDLVPAPGYVAFKRELFARIDPAYRRVLDPAAPARVRVEEIVFGGARLGGIPELVDPPVVGAEAAGLADDELVFGVEVGGEARAYPHRYLSWHEMANDVVGGEPIVLSY
jgi:hypothetical protein